MEEQPVKPLAVVERYDQFINYAREHYVRTHEHGQRALPG